MRIDELAKAAEAVGDEQWHSDGTGTIYLCDVDPFNGPAEDGQEVAEIYLRTDGKDEARQIFVAAANPATVLELVRQLREAEAAVKTLDALSEATPVCWIRFRSDGCYEGPLMHAQMEEVRIKSGAWTPLIVWPSANSPWQEGGLILDKNEVEFLAARVRRLCVKFEYPIGSESDAFIVGVAGSLIGGILTNLELKERQQPEESCDDIELAEMILSDCGISGVATALKDRIAKRIAKHRGAATPCQGNARQQEAEELAEWVEQKEKALHEKFVASLGEQEAKSGVE